MSGDQLIDMVAASTGLPKEQLSGELKRLLLKSGKDPARASLEDLRAVLADYLQEVLSEAKDSCA